MLYIYLSIITTGLFPHYLWLFKEFLPLLRETMSFQGKHIIRRKLSNKRKKNLFCINLIKLFSDHLLTLVSQWKEKIVEELSEEKNILFIGVHCRRTDYEGHYKYMSHSLLVDKVYFDTAFDIYRRGY